MKRWLELISDAEMSPRVTEWERGFLADLESRIGQYGEDTRISERQMEVLERIEGKVYGT